ncbi:MAG: hypothetical protein NC429_03435 [Lachnospiraceae bacterium]|nr:hypothetical protein [Lachnospiraceae bacterium]
MNIKRKLNSLYKLLVSNRITKPEVLGEKLIILATAPDVARFLDNKSVQERFRDYDVACINYMIYYSFDILRVIKPKYLVLLDPCLYDINILPDLPETPNAAELSMTLENIDWNCGIVTNVLADFDVDNPYLSYIRLSCFSAKYSKYLIPMIKKNLINLGTNNVIMGAIFFGIVFGYKKIALMGCPNRSLNAYMTEEGLHVVEHKHYYDEKAYEYTVSYEELSKWKESFFSAINRRAISNNRTIWDLSLLAKEYGCEIVNYSPQNEMDAFMTKDF